MRAHVKIAPGVPRGWETITKNKNHQLLAVCIFVIATAWLVTAAPQSKPSNSKVVKKLREIVKIHEQIEQNQRLLAAAGQSKPDPAKSTIPLLRARIDLARELGKQQEIVTHLRELVTVCNARYHRARARQGVDSRDMMAKARIQLLKTEIELERAIGG